MKVGSNEAQELKRLAEEKKIPFANLLEGYVLEDLMLRLSNSDSWERLWLKNPKLLEEETYRKGEERQIVFYYEVTKKVIFSSEVVENLMEHYLMEENMRGVRWAFTCCANGEGVVVKLTATYREMQVPLMMTILPTSLEVQRPEKRVKELVAMPGKVLIYYVYSAENQLSQDMFQIIDKLELIGDMGCYDHVYQISNSQSLSGRHLLEEMNTMMETYPQVKKEIRLQQLEGYRKYAYMRKRWEQYAKRHGRILVSWEEVLDRVLAVISPIWTSVCRDEIFFDDWMPEIGRYM